MIQITPKSDGQWAAKCVIKVDPIPVTGAGPDRLGQFRWKLRKVQHENL